MDPSQLKKYDCPHCAKTFKTKPHLNRHLVTHEPDGQVKCQICGKILKNRNSIPLHLSYTHGNQKKVRCDICGREFTFIGNLRKHVKLIHSTIPRDRTSCPFVGCDKSFLNKRHVTRHLKIVHDDSPIRYPCPNCDRKFKCKEYLGKHMQSHSRVWLPCRFVGCEKTYLSQTGLHIHIKMKHAENPVRFPCPLCGKEFSLEKTLHDHINTHTTEKTHKCPTCGKSFLHKNNMIRHQATHLETVARKKFPCQLCPRTFLSRPGVRTHKKNYHTIKKRHSCQLCRYKTNWSGNLTDHVKRMHEIDSRSVECYFCGHKFFHFSELVKHSKRHTLELGNPLLPQNIT